MILCLFACIPSKKPGKPSGKGRDNNSRRKRRKENNPNNTKIF
jgi:hypothetical protein